MIAADDIEAVTVAEIAATYGLDAEILDSRLRLLLTGGYEVAESTAAQPGAGDTKKLRAKLARQAAALRETIGNIRIDSSLHAELFDKYKHLYILHDKELPGLIEAASSITPKGMHNIKAETLKPNMLISHMARFRHQQTGERPTYSTDSMTGERSGAV